MGLFDIRRKHAMPSAETALPGREEPMPVPPAHFVNGNPLQGPFPGDLQQAMFGMGCFWGVERIFWQREGVFTTAVGYAAGITPNPTYREVCSGLTGHAEVARVTFDPAVTTVDHLLEVFWKTHDPTTLNRQGPDVGTQYRSVIFYHDDEQKKLAETYKAKLDKSGAFPSKIVTEISKAPKFYVAEDYHQDYYRNNPNERYCVFMVRPKVEKFKQVFADKVADNE